MNDPLSRAREALNDAFEFLGSVDGAADIRGRLLIALASLQPDTPAVVGEDSPITARQLADAFGCFWNAAIDEAHNKQDNTAFATIGCMAEGFAAIERRLTELSTPPAPEPSKAAIHKAMLFATPPQPDVSALVDALREIAQDFEDFTPDPVRGWFDMAVVQRYIAAKALSQYEASASTRAEGDA